MKHGIRKMTMQKLIASMGISTKTVYQYFDSKEQLLEACLNQMYGRMKDDAQSILDKAPSPVLALLGMFRAAFSLDFGVNHSFFHDLNYYYPDLQNKAIDRQRNNFRKLFMPIVQRSVAEGYIDPRVDLDIAMKGVSTLYASITRGEEYRNYKGSFPELFRNLVEVYIKGMCTEKGRREIENHPQ